ncbi:MAG: HAD-IIB family hydrolase [Clostridia bacterium]|nr:HAD-IIB family hydrolase [Clostridia bacterium]
MANTLYVTDLDGTLLRSDQTLSRFTCDTINALVEKGMLFSFATARSIVTSRKVAAGLVPQIPQIVYNGSFIVDRTGKRLWTSFFTPQDAQEILSLLLQAGVVPIVYSVIDGQEKFSFDPARANRATLEFNESRKNDPRRNYVESYDHLGEMFYFTCIDTPERLGPLHEILRKKYHCVYGKDIYSGEQWLEIVASTKAEAALQLKALFHCDRLVCFGDGKNDIPMFAIADECYAVANADPALKAVATGVIASNMEDGVPRWLLENADF